MGLDLVEYIIAVEDAFELAIPDADAARLDTPHRLVDYLSARLIESNDGPPLVQAAFYRLRRAIAEELGVERSLIRPDTVLAQLTDKPVDSVWKAVAQRIGIEPKLLTHAPVVRWLARVQHAPHRTIGAIAEQLAMLRPAAIKTAGSGWTRSQVVEVVLRLLEYETGVGVTPSQLDLTFVRDLGMG